MLKRDFPKKFKMKICKEHANNYRETERTVFKSYRTLENQEKSIIYWSPELPAMTVKIWNFMGYHACIWKKMSVVCFLLGNSSASEFYMPTFQLLILCGCISSSISCLMSYWTWNAPTQYQQPKRRHIKFRRRGITQKETYNIQNTAKVWNQGNFC